MFLEGNVNSTILQGSICYGGNSSNMAMIVQRRGNSYFSKTNITNCVSSIATCFYSEEVGSTTNVSFCNFEKLEASQFTITVFSSCPGIIEKCNYINNSQKNTDWGLVSVMLKKRHDILDSSFQNNLKDVPLFATRYGGDISIIRCYADKFTTIGLVDTSEMTTNSFINEIEIYITSPCEEKLIMQNQDKKDSIFKKLKFIALIMLFKSK